MGGVFFFFFNEGEDFSCTIGEIILPYGRWKIKSSLYADTSFQICKTNSQRLKK